VQVSIIQNIRYTRILHGFPQSTHTHTNYMLLSQLCNTTSSQICYSLVRVCFPRHNSNYAKVFNFLFHSTHASYKILSQLRHKRFLPKKMNSVHLVHQRTIPTEQQPGSFHTSYNSTLMYHPTILCYYGYQQYCETNHNKRQRAASVSIYFCCITLQYKQCIMKCGTDAYKTNCW
jgi:hypothetical protein